MLLGWMCSVVRAGARLGNSSLWVGQTDGWIWQRLSKPFVTAVLLKIEAVLELEHERSTMYLGCWDLSVKSVEG